MAMRGSISGSSGNIGSVSTKNTGNVFNGTTDGYWKRGLSAYEVAVSYGFQGTAEEWLASLQGKSVAIASVQEYENHTVITFSDGKKIDVKNGSQITFKLSPDNKIYWRYTNDDDPNNWKLMVDVKSIVNDEFDMRAVNYANLYYNTKEGWDSMVNYVSELGTIYYYEDYYTETDEHGNTITKPGIKIGDGMAYLIDLPFLGSIGSPTDHTTLYEHINDTSVHVTEQEKMFWNNKCRVDETQVDNENLIFTIN